MNEITELNIEEFFQVLTCKRSTKLDWLVVMRKIFELARKGKAIEKNIVNDFKLPIESSDDDAGAVVPFSPEEIQSLLLHSKGTILHNYLGIAFHLGCRPQEVIALKIKDIDYENMLVHIARAITKGKLKKTKTSQSERSIPLPSQALKFFKEQIAYAKSKRSQFLFCFSNGTRLNDILDLRGRPDRTGPWYALVEKAGIPMRAMRQTRHTFAVQAIKSGAYTLQEISAILGHTSLSMLFKHYGKHLGKSHLKVSRSVDIFEGLGDFLGDFDKNSVDDSLSKKA
jgi:integrase